MDVEEQQKEEEDPFLNFVDQARSELLSLDDDSNRDDLDTSGYGWSWIVSRILKTCIAYSSGVTPAILLSELSQVFIIRLDVIVSYNNYFHQLVRLDDKIP
jgi:hypothetical protein